MKFTYLAIILFYSNSVWGQDKVDLTCFTLGLVSDYNGRTIVKSDKFESTKIDRFHEAQIDIMDLLDSLINEENKSRDRDKQITKKRTRTKEPHCTNCDEFFDYYSKELATDLNSKYNFKFAHSWDLKERKIYRGRIKISGFKNDLQRFSFLSGAYLTSGSMEGDVFIYHLANSVEKFDLIVKSLKKLDCEIRDTKVEGGIPVSQKVYFIPSDKLKPELARYEGLKKKIEIRYSLFYNGRQ
jgi:hypothetical protein